MGVRACTVSFLGEQGVRHSVEVTGESLYDCAALALAVFRRPGTLLEVEVREPATIHTVTVTQLRRWCDGVAVSPEAILRRRKVKSLIG